METGGGVTGPCGAPGEKGDCSDVLNDVWMFLDDEMDVARRSAVQHHLDDCSPCLEEAGLTQKLKSLLHNKCGGDRAPEELRSRLVTKLSALQVTADARGADITWTEVTQVTTVRTDQA
ncbi:mycothiol system anti-sigma-R factor [Nakamurella sp. YIM 132087]|uniref:Mycothiol system anti-sigma-R factor n=1 Tax=Nakamurella alba TaxID=2665158 RepID=A0A7K1FFV0_9ACTN|nr:mycothiol system anti-sigma-R factor [Nakamurella alba]MTD12991.1 mycothiol system anti-sigma-R factor [Nakamurella alba]